MSDVVALPGNGSRFDLVYRAEYVPLLRLAVLLVGQRAVAEDLVHDAFLRWQGHAAHVEHPKAYLRTTLINLCRNRHRGVERESARLVRVAAGESTDAELVADAEVRGEWPNFESAIEVDAASIRIALSRNSVHRVVVLGNPPAGGGRTCVTMTV